MQVQFNGTAEELIDFARTLVRGAKALRADRLRAEAKQRAIDEANKPTPAQIEAELWPIIDTGNWIGAIKRHRELTGLGLKESKDFVEALKQQGKR